MDVLENLKTIPQHTVPGSSCQDQDPPIVNLTLFCFCDASAKAYATVVYLLQSSPKLRRVDLIFSKTHLALQRIRLELLGVLIGIHALKFVETDSLD